MDSSQKRTTIGPATAMQPLQGRILSRGECGFVLALLFLGCFALPLNAEDTTPASVLRFEVTLGESLADEPLTGRLFITTSLTEKPVPRVASYNSVRLRDGLNPFFAIDVDGLAEGQSVVVDSAAIGYPMWSLEDLPAGEYYVQAVLHLYTEFRRADGHTIWAPMDQWEGQRWGFSPGNLVSKPVKVSLDPGEAITVRLELDDVIPPIPEPEDTQWVKHIKFQSKILTEFWGHPMYLGATVVVPKGYEDNAHTRYPAMYEMQHFSTKPAFSFQTEPPKPHPLWAEMLAATGGKQDTGYDLYEAWIGEDFPRMFMIRLLHPTPYFDDSYGVNSANNGPYGDALLTELIPYLEREFRIIPESYARVLTGGSTGGWISMALQLYHPKFFGGTWVLFPDPLDFRNYGLINIYDDDNAFIVPGSVAGAPERMAQRTTGGQPVSTVRQWSHRELAEGTKGRSGGQLDIWNATFGPVGDDGYPQPLWDKRTGEIDHEVAQYMKDNGYDLRHYAEMNWSTIGPDLVGKIHLYNPEMDQFYLPYSVYRMEDFLENTKNPYYGGEVIHGRPQKGHGWRPMTRAGLIETMAEHIAENAPKGTVTSAWMEQR